MSHRSCISLTFNVCAGMCVFTCTVHSSSLQCVWMDALFVNVCAHAGVLPGFLHSSLFRLGPEHSGKQTGATRWEGKMKWKKRKKKKEWVGLASYDSFHSEAEVPGLFLSLLRICSHKQADCDVISRLCFLFFYFPFFHLPFHCLSIIFNTFFTWPWIMTFDPKY